tara:strand:+ start:1624 stop:2619 length:996 start_codon:yes stop_codon:yes gene_type:complete
MFIKDKIIPNTIDDFIIHKSTAIKLEKLFNKNFIENLYVYGAAGVGKYTLVIKLLEKIVGTPIKIFLRKINVNNNWSNAREIELSCSDYHFEINLSKYSNNKNNLFSIIEKLCESKEINQHLPYKIIIIRNIHVATDELIRFIKQKSELCVDYTKFILIGITKSNIMSSFRGVFFSFRIPSPYPDDIISVLKKHKYKFKTQDMVAIINDSNNNLSIIFTKFELKQLANFYKSRGESTSEKIRKLLKDKKLSNLYTIRELLYDYQIHNEDLDVLVRSILTYFLNQNEDVFNKDKKFQLISLACKNDLNKKHSYKEIIHIEQLLFSIFKLFHS